MAKNSGDTRMPTPTTDAATKTATSNNGALEIHERIASKAVVRLRKIIDDKERDGFTKDATQFKFGTLSRGLAEKYQELTGTKIINRDMYTGASSLFHHRGGEKADKGKETPLEDIANMPINIGAMDVFLFKNEIIFTDYKNKYVLKPNQRVKTENGRIIVTNHVSNSKVKDMDLFTRANGYKKINP